MIRTTRFSLLAMAALTSMSVFAQEVTQAPVLPKCSAPIASVMVGNLQCKAANCKAAGDTAGAGSGIAALVALAQAQNGGAPTNLTGIADGIKDVLVTALTESGCFRVQDRDQMAEIAAELKLAGKEIKAEQAEFLISGAVTQIDVSQENKSGGGVLGGILGGGVLGAIASNIGYKTSKAAVALDMKLVAVDTAKVVASKRATASTETSSFSMSGGAGAMGGGFGGFGGSFESLKGTNLEAVTKDAIVQSVTFLVEEARKAKSAAL